jgi:divalent metal cation (Fe/Co/Zn/Cd) transporter
MKKILISIGILCGGIFLGFLTFNHIDAWAGIAVTIISIGVFLNYIYKQIKNYSNEKL